MLKGRCLGRGSFVPIPVSRERENERCEQFCSDILQATCYSSMKGPRRRAVNATEVLIGRPGQCRHGVSNCRSARTRLLERRTEAKQSERIQLGFLCRNRDLSRGCIGGVPLFPLVFIGNISRNVVSKPERRHCRQLSPSTDTSRFHHAEVV